MKCIKSYLTLATLLFISVAFSNPSNGQTVVSPSATGIFWRVGAFYEISWSGFTPAFLNPVVTIDLYKGGSFYKTIASVSNSGSGSYWYVGVSADPGTDYQIRIHSAFLSDYSDNYFNIGDPKVTYPSASGIRLYGGVTYNITWSGFTGASNVNIYLYKGGGSAYSTIAYFTENDGSFSWTVPMSYPTGSDYTIEINSYGITDHYYDGSDNAFTIAKPTVLFPSATGITWYTGDTYNITWSGFYGSYVKIELIEKLDFSNEYSIISTITSATANDGSYSWTVPKTLSSWAQYNFLIRITSTANTTISDISDNVFTIRWPTVQIPSAEFITWYGGATYDIKWYYFPGSYVKIELYKAGSLYSTITSSTDNDGLYSWTVPKTLPASGLGADYKIRITSTANANVFGESHYNFTIRQPNVSYPSASGITWHIGSPPPYDITWYGFYGSNVRIDLYKGSSQYYTITPSTTNDGRESWTVPTTLPVGSDYRIMITSIENAAIYDFSDNYFTIAEAACINETFTAATGTITDNSGASDYLNNMTCEKLIQPSGGGTINLTFTSFATESGYDFVRVYAGSTTSAPLLGTFSGSSLPPVLTSSSGSMLIRFTTDGSVVAAGWSATYGPGVPPSGCTNETFTAASGTVTDNSGALDYQNNMTCEKLIQPSGGGTITLTFISFATESGYDFVRVYAGSTTSAPLLGTFSGSSLPPVLTSSSGSMLIRFTTDGSVVAAGWSATYGPGVPPSGCTNETFTAASGTVTDNSGALDYQNNMTCEKLIQPSGGGTITLTFTSFATESGYDLVRVYAGSTTSAPLLGTFSGSSLPPVLTSSSGSMLIRFTTDGSVVAAGWSATYGPGVPPSGCTNETFTAASGTVTDNSGALDYQNNMTCEKLIQPSGGGTITLTFTSFATESGYDFVRVYAGSTTSAPLLGTFSGNSLPPVLTSIAGSMLITFTSDASVVAAGWSAGYTAVYGGCFNETNTHTSGTITDNSGALDYLNNMTCEKLIQPIGSGHITLTFTAFSTEANYDLVRVYAGSTTSAPLLGTFSGSSLPPVLTSGAGSMLIRFTTDGSVVAAGWSATYTSSLTSGGKGAEEISEKEILQDTKLVAYPNPTSGILTVESSFAEEETYTIELINTSGQVILNQKINIIGGKFDIDISDVSSGLYLLQIRTGRTVQYIRVIKN